MKESDTNCDNFAKVVQCEEIEQLLTQAVNFQMEGSNLQAAHIYQQIISINEYQPEALNNLSVLLDPHSALKLLKKSISSNPNYSDALINISARYLELGNISQARKYIRRVQYLEDKDQRVTQLVSMINAKEKVKEEYEIDLKKPPKYSIIIPTHCRSLLLKRALESINQQRNGTVVEIIVVSDVEDELTNRVCSKLLSKHDTYIKRSGKAGPSASRNIAMSLIRGEVVIFLDDDDAWHPNLLHELNQCVPLHNGMPVYFDCTVIQESRHSEEPVFISSKHVSNRGKLTEHVFIKNQVHMSCFAFPRIVLQDLEFDVHMRAYEDWEFLLSVFEKTFPVHVPILGSRIYEVEDESTDRRGSTLEANDFNAVIDFIYVYRRHQVNSSLRESRSKFLETVGIKLSPNLL
jgi:glycosyltransferase involved in cell wall biosynthesis